VTLTDSLSQWLEVAPTDALVQQVLAGKSPQERAAELVHGTKLRDVAARKALGEGGKAAVDASTDPMIQVARIVDPRGRELRKQYDDNIAEVLRQSYAKIANAQFKTSGGDTYPDATFTLRLSYGTVKSYMENGKEVPSLTKIGDTFEHAAAHGNEGDFKL